MIKFTGNLLLICGWPRTGKTTLANEVAAARSIVAMHTDDLIGRLDWSAASEKVAEWIDLPDAGIIEGVAVCRAMRKWMATNPGKKFPTGTQVLILREPFEKLAPGQTTMGKGIDTVWREIEREVKDRGAVVLS